MGEVQHSFFVSTHHFDVNGKIGPPRSSGKNPLVPLFSWNEILGFKHQRAIGDPLMYSPTLRQYDWSASQPRTPAGSVLVMPKKNNEETYSARVNSYKKLISFARVVAPREELLLSLHPSDRDIQEQLCQSLDFLKSFKPLMAATNYAPGEGTVEQLSRARLIVSDYFGAHLIRANAYFGAEYSLPANYGMPVATDKNLRPILEELLRLPSGCPVAQEMCRELVGVPNKMSVEELTNTLYRPEEPQLTKRIVIAGYQKWRRTKVHLRQSKWVGKSWPVKQFRQHILARLWARKFL